MTSGKYRGKNPILWAKMVLLLVKLICGDNNENTHFPLHPLTHNIYMCMYTLHSLYPLEHFPPKYTKITTVYFHLVYTFEQYYRLYK